MGNFFSKIRDFLLEPLLWLTIVWIYWVNAGSSGLGQPEEIFFIQTAREMALTNSWAVPSFNQETFLNNPPLFLWMTLLSFKTFGISLWAARIPSALMGLVGLLITHSLSLALFNNRMAAFLATITLATSWGYFWTSHEATSTVVFVFLLQLISWFFYWWYQTAARPKLFTWDKQSLSIGMGVVLGLLFLAKGPMGFLTPLCIFLPFMAITGKLERLVSLDWKRFLIACLVVILPWPIWVSIQTHNPFFLFDYLFKYPYLQTMAGPGEPFLKSLFIGFFVWLFPWNFFLIGGLIDPKGLRKSFHKNNDSLIFLCVWMVVGLVLSLIFGEEGPSVIMAIYIPVILFVGLYLSKIIEGFGTSPSYQWATEGIILILFGLAVFSTYFIFQFLPDEYPGSLWNMPGPAILSKVTLPLGADAPFYKALSSLPVFNKELELPNLFPVWKLWLLPGPFILILSGILIYSLSKTDRSHEIPVALLGISVVSLVFVSYIVLPVTSRPLSERMAAIINQRISTVEKRNSGPPTVTILVDGRGDRQLLRIPFFLNLNQSAGPQQVWPQFIYSRSASVIENAIAEASPKHLVFAVMDEKNYYDLNDKTRESIRVLENHWKWCSSGQGTALCLWPDKKDQGDFIRMTDEVLLIEALRPFQEKVPVGSNSNMVPMMNKPPSDFKGYFKPLSKSPILQSAPD